MTAAPQPKATIRRRIFRFWRGLEAVPGASGMYIGGTDEQSLHHLVAEILDNSMDEAVAGFANRIELSLTPTIR